MDFDAASDSRKSSLHGCRVKNETKLRSSPFFSARKAPVPPVRICIDVDDKFQLNPEVRNRRFDKKLSQLLSKMMLSCCIVFQAPATHVTSSIFVSSSASAVIAWPVFSNKHPAVIGRQSQHRSFSRRRRLSGRSTPCTL